MGTVITMIVIAAVVFGISLVRGANRVNKSSAIGAVEHDGE